MKSVDRRNRILPTCELWIMMTNDDCKTAKLRGVLSPGICAQIACILEVSVPKVGNVHRYRDFKDLTYLDFLLSALAITSSMDGAPNRSLGETILEAVTRTREVINTNTNLGMILLLAPLASTFHEPDQRRALQLRLATTTQRDAELVYEAIRRAEPGALGVVDTEDVNSHPTRSLLEVMALAADRDRIAFQYCNAFADVFNEGLPTLKDALLEKLPLDQAICYCHLKFLSKFPDTLVRRKCGAEEAERASVLASDVVSAGWPHTDDGQQRFASLDRWLSSDDHRRNPGTSADLTAASLFLAIRDGIIKLPLDSNCR